MNDSFMTIHGYKHFPPRIIPSCDLWFNRKNEEFYINRKGSAVL
jgi:hypothetical protein